MKSKVHIAALRISMLASKNRSEKSKSRNRAGTETLHFHLVLV